MKKVLVLLMIVAMMMGMMLVVMAEEDGASGEAETETTKEIGYDWWGNTKITVQSEDNSYVVYKRDEGIVMARIDEEGNEIISMLFPTEDVAPVDEDFLRSLNENGYRMKLAVDYVGQMLY